MTSPLPGVVRFGLGAAFSYTLVIGLTAALHEGTGLPPSTAYAIALGVALVVNFFVNRHLVFRATNSTQSSRHQAWRFAAASVSFRLGEWSLFWILETLTGTHYAVLATAVQIVSLGLKYVVFRRFVFR
jgi:putative flippase GtrA